MFGSSTATGGGGSDDVNVEEVVVTCGNVEDVQAPEYILENIEYLRYMG